MSTPGPGFIKIKARFCQINDQVGQGHGQELDNKYEWTDKMITCHLGPHHHQFVDTYTPWSFADPKRTKVTKDKWEIIEKFESRKLVLFEHYAFARIRIQNQMLYNEGVKMNQKGPHISDLKLQVLYYKCS